MAKRWRKQKAQHQAPKKRKAMAGDGTGSSSSGAMGSLRGGLRGLFGGSRKSSSLSGSAGSSTSRVIDILLWVAVGVAAVLFLRRQCGG